MTPLTNTPTQATSSPRPGRLDTKPAQATPGRLGPGAPTLRVDRQAATDADWEELRPRNWYGRWGKHGTTFALFALTLPLALVLAIPIALVNWALFGDLRKILYSQPRVGYRGRTFWIYKFRTMREARSGDFSSWKDGSDPSRVTRFGRILRCTHLDELAQFLNVARGEMVFIGPRPEMTEIDEWAQSEIADFDHRLALKPGITGFSQITLGYTGVDVDAYRAKLAADERYRRDFSLGLDLQILFRTAVWMLRGRGWDWNAPKTPTNSNASDERTDDGKPTATASDPARRAA